MLKEQDLLKNYDMKIIILSRGRSSMIKKNTCSILPNWIEVLVPESEVEEYRNEIDNPILTVPDHIEGLGQLRNWCLDNFKEEILLMLDDDISKFYCLTGELTRKVSDPLEVVQIMINTAIMCKDAGLHCFGFSQTDIRKYNGTEPFRLCTWIGCAVGIVGRKYRFRDDKFKVDIDYCLQNLLVDRIIWVDNRYYTQQLRDCNLGGNAKFRTNEDYNKSVDSLKDKWGVYLKTRNTFKSTMKINIDVDRRQKIEYE